MSETHVMSPTDKDVAEYFRLALHCGVVGVDSVARWARSVAGRAGTRLEWATRLALCEHESTREVEHALSLVGGASTARLPGYLLLARARRCWQRGEVDGESLTRTLYELWPSGVLPEEAEAEVVAVDDGYDLVDEGKRDRGGADRRLTSLLARFEGYERLLPG
jgi:hypothetical protein